MKSILIVEDEEDMVEIISYTLKENGFTVLSARTASEMWERLTNDKVDLILLDIGLPDESGIDVLKALRRQGNDVPIVILTARRSDVDKILGLELGADDYVTKPFNRYELVARIRTVLRRYAGHKVNKSIVKLGENTLNMDSYTAVDSEGNEIEFTKKEFGLLKLLISNPKKVFTREEILDRIWGEDFFGDFRTVDVHVSKIREKLGDSVIKTVRGVGYKLGETNNG